MATFFHCMVVLGSLIGGYIFFNSFASRGNLAADTVVALAFVVFPYCLARSLEYLTEPNDGRDAELLATLRQINHLITLAVKMGNEPVSQLPPAVKRGNPLTK